MSAQTIVCAICTFRRRKKKTVKITPTNVDGTSQEPPVVESDTVKPPLIGPVIPDVTGKASPEVDSSSRESNGKRGEDPSKSTEEEIDDDYVYRYVF